METLTKYQLKKGETTVQFKRLTGPESVEEFKQRYPDWANVAYEVIEEVPQQEKPPVPHEVGMFRFHFICEQTASPLPGFPNLYELITFLFTQMPEGQQKALAQKAWQRGSTILRSSDSLSLFKEKVNEAAGTEVITEQYIDNLFIQSEALRL